MHTKPYKLIAFDIDGTILDSDVQVCKRLVKVVMHLKSLGYLFVLVTARFPVSVFRIAQVLGVDVGLITLNGSFITNWAREVLYSRTFPVARISSRLLQMKQNVAINYYYNFEWVIENNSKYTDLELAVLHDVNNIQKVETLPQVVNKVTLIGETPELMLAKELFVPDSTLNVSFSHPENLEIACRTISKFTGLIHYANQKNILAHQIIAFGDGENDIEMLAGVGLGVAMKNASDVVQKAAKDIAGYHYEEGVAVYLEQLLQKKIL